MSYFKKLTFIKVMTTVAWADGEMTHSELNLLKSFIRKFGLDQKDMDELQPYLEAPVSKERQEELFNQLIAELSSPEEKQEVLSAMQTLAGGQEQKTEEEKALLDQFTSWLKESSFTTRSFGKIRNFFGGTLFTNARQKDPELEQYFKRKVLHNIELKSNRSGQDVTLSEDTLYSICLFGTLLASVAEADGSFDDSERQALKTVLTERFGYDEEQLAILFEVVEEQAKRGFDFHEVVTELNKQVSYNDRVKLMRCFFAIATADGDISHEESEQIRRITKAMHIPHQLFKEAKVKALEPLKKNS